MKRGTFKKPTLEEVKKKQAEKREKDKLKVKVKKKGSTLKKKSSSENAKLERKLWEECRRIANIIYDGTKCFTCDKPIEGRNKQLGHFIPKSVSGTALKYNIDNLRWQCYRCNINLGGNQSEFYRRLEKEEGKRYVDHLFMLKNRPPTVKSSEWYKNLLELYKQKYEE